MTKRISKSGYIGVYQNKDGSLYRFESYLVKDSNEKRYVRGGFKTAYDAYQAKLKYESKMRVLLDIKEVKTNVGYLVENYLNWKKPTLRITTFHHKELLIDQYIIRPFGLWSIRKFTSIENLKMFRENIINKPISTGQKNKIFNELNGIFKFSCMSRFVDSGEANNVYINTTKLKETDIKTDRDDMYWSIQEWKQFISTFSKKDKWYVLFSLFGHLGCRIGELRGLQNKHINLEKGTVRIEQQVLNNVGSKEFVIGLPKTKSSVRTIYVSDQIVNILKGYIKYNSHYNPDNFLFFNCYHPLGVSTIRREFNAHIAKARLRRIRLHGIRHSNTTWLLSEVLNPQDIGQVSRRLGHASVRETLDTYLYIHNDKNKKIIGKLDELI